MPESVTTDQVAPADGATDVSVNVGMTVKTTLPLDWPPTVTVTGPLVAPNGTAAVMDVADHAVGVASVPLKRTVFVPGVAPKLLPVSVTTAPTTPDVGDSVFSVGGGITVNGLPVLV